LTGGRASATVVAFDARSRLLAVGAVDGSVTGWDLTRSPRLREPRPLLPGTGKPDNLSGIAGLGFSADGRHLIAWLGQSLIRTDVHGRTLPARPFDKLIATISANETRAAWITNEGDVQLVRYLTDASPGPPLVHLDPGDVGSSVTLSDDGRWLAVDDDQGDISIWDTASRSKLVDLPVAGSPALLTFAGNRLVGFWGRTLAIWNLSLADMRRRACAILGRSPTRQQWAAMVGRNRRFVRLCPTIG